MSYPDVSTASSYYQAVSFLQKIGVMAGDVRGHFNPLQSVTLAEVFVALCNFFDCIPGFPAPKNFPRQDWFLERFPQYAWVEYYFRMFWCNGWIKHDSIWLSEKLGTPITSEGFKQIILASTSVSLPILTKSEENSPLTRAEMAELIYETIKQLAAKPQSDLNSALISGEFPSALSIIKDNAILLSCLDTDIALLSKLIQSSLRKQPDFALVQLEKMYYILEIKRSLVTKEDDVPIFHYCSLETLEKLSSGIKFRAYHTTYLNDLEEGKKAIPLYQELLEGTPFPDWTPDALWNTSYHTGVFTVSFISNPENSLPMWSQYGNQYRGCRLQVNAESFKGKLFPVIYDEEKFTGTVRSIIQILTDYYNEAPKPLSYNKDAVFCYAENILQFIRFLYKDPAFRNEKEIRLLIFRDMDATLAESEVRSGESFPRIYTEIDDFPRIQPDIPDSPLNFKEILLGPKVEKPEWVKISLIQRGYNAELIKQNDIKLQ